MYLGQASTAAAIVRGARLGRIAAQLQPDGQLPLEEARTRSWHYVNFDLTAFCRLAATGRRVGVNLWAYTAPNGATLRKAVDFVIPAAERGAAAWAFPDLDGVDRSLPVPVFHEADEAVGLCTIFPAERLVDGPGVVPAARDPARYARLLLGACAELGPGAIDLESWGDDPAVIASYETLGFAAVERVTGWQLRLA